jgi:hypothetical protein
MAMEHYDVLIATPGHSLEAQYVASLTDTLTALNEMGISFKWLNAYSSLVHNARELTATGGQDRSLNALDAGPMGGSVTYNKIFWIDSDISWTPEQFIKLYSSEYDVVTGAYLLADGVTTSVHELGSSVGITADKIRSLTEPLKIESMGFGFTAIKTGVFEKLERPWFGHYTQKINLPNKKTIETFLGEDISWCINANRAGFEIYFDPTVLVTHMKKVKIEW